MTGVANASRPTVELREVKVHRPQPRPYSYTVVNINAFTLEEQLILYPFLVVDEQQQQPVTSVVVEIK